MNLEPLQLRAILQRYRIRPDKAGTKFLADHNILLRCRDAGIDPEDCVLEIGAGLGNWRVFWL